MPKITVEIEYQDGAARELSVDDIRRAVIAFVPHKIISVQQAAQQSAQADTFHVCGRCGGKQEQVWSCPVCDYS